jgi:hypothetical protein
MRFEQEEEGGGEGSNQRIKSVYLQLEAPCSIVFSAASRSTGRRKGKSTLSFWILRKMQGGIRFAPYTNRNSITIFFKRDLSFFPFIFSQIRNKI